MASHLMDDVGALRNIVLLTRLAAQGRIEDLKAIDREIEVRLENDPELEQALGREGLGSSGKS